MSASAAAISNGAGESPYVMNIDMRVLDHLGIHLYSNAAAVLSEAVANAWDADSNAVKVDLKDTEIIVEDDGVGMDLGTINARFLFVGYDKRSKEGIRSPKGRLFMGRKGIGKLSLFSVADIVTVYTVKDGVENAFKMVTSDIRTAIDAGKQYRPTPVQKANIQKGTKIVLTGLKKRRLIRTEDALRKRIARRFSIIGFTSAAGDKFDVVVNGKPISHDDREDLKTIEFLWEFGAEKIKKEIQCPNLKRFETLSDAIDSVQGWFISGWLGAAPRPTDLRKDDAGSMNGIVVVARGRLIQENILDKLDFNKLFTSYVTGQVEADFLDMEGFDDIATSDRQRIIEDDDRYVALIKFLRDTMYSIAEKWSSWRSEQRGLEAIEKSPGLENWVLTLPEGQRKAARKMLGLVEGVEVETEEDRRALYRAGVLAFERLSLKSASHELSELKELTAEELLPLLADLSALEGTMYRDIVRERLAVINAFTGLVDDNEKEKVLQKFIFDNMWLLDPGWERATESVRMEERLKTQYAEFADDLTDDQSKGRIDIRYRKNAGQHIIVELKRVGRKLSVWELGQQGFKYKSALEACVRAEEGQTVIPHVEIVFVLGQPIAEEAQDARMVVDNLKTYNARVVYYEQLIKSATNAYGEFLEKSRLSDKIEAIVNSL